MSPRNNGCMSPQQRALVKLGYPTVLYATAFIIAVVFGNRGVWYAIHMMKNKPFVAVDSIRLI